MTNKAVKTLKKEGDKTFTLYGQKLGAPALDAGLHIVATPIGNLEDITLRGLKTLAGADRIACEDTRVSMKLLQRYGIYNPLLSYHEHNARSQGQKLLEFIKKGEAIALISDAGTPLLSDPGAQLVADSVGAGFKVFSYPGASALLTALVVSALEAERFHFIGFLPPKSTARRKELDKIKSIPDALVFYETAPRLTAAFADMLRVLGDRQAAMCRELTKLHETVVRGSLSDLATQFESESVKGEIVIVVGPARAQKVEYAIDPQLIDAMKNHSLKEAVAIVAAESGAPRRKVYEQALKLKDKK
jgi:16S rRNA (cytidine1402-2'-O)-methyltransferase